MVGLASADHIREYKNNHTIAVRVGYCRSGYPYPDMNVHKIKAFIVVYILTVGVRASRPTEILKKVF